MFIFIAAAALSTITPVDAKAHYSLYEDAVASGMTSRITPTDRGTKKKTVVVKKKRLVTLIPQTNGLDQIIAKIKRENGIKTRS